MPLKLIKASVPLIVSIFYLVLSGCQQTPIKDHNSPNYSVPVGSSLTLNQPITIPADLARVYIQNGRLITREQNTNIYYPHCSITLKTIKSHNRTIHPDRFEITQVKDDEEHAQHYIMNASLLSMDSSDGPSIIGYSSYYYLHSNQQPDVNTLECIQWNDPFDIEYVTINEIKKTLGQVFTLEIND